MQAVMPVGNIPEDVMRRYVSLIATHKQVSPATTANTGLHNMCSTCFRKAHNERHDCNLAGGAVKLPIHCSNTGQKSIQVISVEDWGHALPLSSCTSAL